LYFASYNAYVCGNITLLFSSLPIGAFQWPITSSIMITYVSLDYLSLQQWEYDTTFLTVFILTHPANFALWEETGAKYKIQLPWKHLNCNP
jgi:hypothetical protein